MPKLVQPRVICEFGPRFLAPVAVWHVCFNGIDRLFCIANQRA
jgi:hypothetical protein